jgi:hypothetical protein
MDFFYVLDTVWYAYLKKHLLNNWAAGSSLIIISEEARASNILIISDEA